VRRGQLQTQPTEKDNSGGSGTWAAKRAREGARERARKGAREILLI